MTGVAIWPRQGCGVTTGLALDAGNVPGLIACVPVPAICQAMDDQLITTLALPERLALSYAPRRAHGATLGLLALDRRLAGILRQGGEPIIAQMKLAWWRERLEEPSDKWPEGEPLLAQLAQWPGDPAGLQALVNGWEWLLDETLQNSAISEFANGRAKAWQSLAQGLGDPASEAAHRAAREWALVDLALNLGQDDERASALAQYQDETRLPVRMGRSMRSLAVLNALARQAARKGGQTLLDKPSSALLALRVGILGR